MCETLKELWKVAGGIAAQEVAGRQVQETQETIFVWIGCYPKTVRGEGSFYNRPASCQQRISCGEYFEESDFQSDDKYENLITYTASIGNRILSLSQCLPNCAETKFNYVFLETADVPSAFGLKFRQDGPIPGTIVFRNPLTFRIQKAVVVLAAYISVMGNEIGMFVIRK